MVGAGQLARMAQQAAVDLDVELLVVAESAGDPAVLAGAPHRVAPPADPAAVLAAVDGVEVVTFDHELVPAPVLHALAGAGHALRPGPEALAFAQDKLHARRALAGAGFPVPAFAPVGGWADVTAFAGAHGWPVVLKARSGGYDGRGVLVVGGPGDAPDVGWDAGWVAEEHLDLAAELAVVVVRRPSGEAVTYPAVRTVQVDGICRELTMPAAEAAAVALGERVAAHAGAVGVCAVELFATADGRLLVNELALRPHNSGHATIEACVTSQFENHLRAVLDWPLGDTRLVAPAAAMVNVITPDAGVDPAANLPAALAVAGAHTHLYAKASRPGRKVGHVTALGDTAEAALTTARAAAGILLRR